MIKVGLIKPGGNKKKSRVDQEEKRNADRNGSILPLEDNMGLDDGTDKTTQDLVEK